MMDIKKIKGDFPILKRKVKGQRLVYLDNAATSQKPRQVIRAMVDYYESHNANIHRGIHTLGDEATKLYQQSREAVARFIGANDSDELVFVRNTTEGINLAAYSWGEENVSEGEVILITEMEHHSNIVPWQELAKRVRARVEYVRVDENGELDLDDLEKKLTGRVKLLALCQVSNFLGTVNPVKEIVEKIRASRYKGVKILVDGAQAVAQMKVDVEDLGVDFYSFSAHKMLGPMGIGGLWVRKEILREMKPFMTGGGMINIVARDKTSYAELPDRFDAGTPNVAGAVGFKAAVEYLQNLGMENIFEHEGELVSYAVEQLRSIKVAKHKSIKIYGPLSTSRHSVERAGLVAFEVPGAHAHDVAQVLDNVGVAVRSGHHCTMLMHNKLKLAATTRMSFGVYNDKEDVDRLIEGLEAVRRVFKL